MGSPPPDHGYPPHRPFYEDDPDADTGPMRVAPTQQAFFPQAPQSPLAPQDTQDTQAYRLPPGAGDSFASRFTAPLTVDPRAQRVKGRGIQPTTVVAIVAAVAVVAALVIVLVRVFDKDDSSEDQADTSGGSPASATAKPADQEKLVSILPRGYEPGACATVSPPTGTLAQVSCRANSDPGGPPAASYTLVADAAALQTAFDGIVASARVVNCPGNIQSPGPWRRNATPQQVAGTLVCGFKKDTPAVAWTDDADLLVASVDGATTGPSLDQLYAWWSSHS